MRILKYSFLVSFFALLLAFPALAFPASNLSSSLSGKILLDVNNKGEAWYVYPGDFHRYYLGTPADAYGIMSNLSLGVSNADFTKITSSTDDKFRGLILLKPEDAGKTYYIDPLDKSINYMGSASGAFNLMRKLSLGITTADLKNIPVGRIILDDSGKQTGRVWQYLGWWGKVNKSSVLVMSEPKNDSNVLGKLSLNNTIKVLALKKNDGRTWYKIDGGQYPSAYIDSQFLGPMPQPVVSKGLVVPDKVKVGDYWVDVNLTTRVLALYKYNEIAMATYISIGNQLTPTMVGSFNVWYKIKSTEMKGAPPNATHVYDLLNVPWVMYYNASYSLHGTYWHDDFGTQRSAGCTNMTQGDAEYIFDLTNPKINQMNLVFSSTDNPGMIVNNHY